MPEHETQLPPVPEAKALPKRKTRLSVVWLVPIATWGLLSAGIGAGNGWGSARVLIVFTIVFAVIVRSERHPFSDGRRNAATVRPVASAGLEPRSSPD